MTVAAADFDFVRRLVADDSALTLDDGKEYLVQARLAPLAERHGLGSVTELIDALRAGTPDLRRQVVEALVTHETLFFRDAHPFDALRTEVIPQILHSGDGRRLSLWSAATSTGQEAYSLALVVREYFPEISEVVLLATDISSRVLAQARTGRYSQLEVGRGLPVSLLVRHFDQTGRAWQLHDDIRHMVTFRQLNLARPFRGVPPMDVVFLRNVLIYFDDETRSRLLTQIGRVLRPGGYLFLGGAESIKGLCETYERVQVGRTLLYRRVDGGDVHV
jgi:chemotaxis protein methyltransferase CheR